MFLSDAYSMTLPVMPAKELGSRQFLSTGVVNGTCFSIGGPYMLTAGHVAATIHDKTDDILTVGIRSPDGFFKSAKVIDAEQLSCDLGILRVEFVYPESEKWFHSFKWSERPLQSLETIRCFGYAYGMNMVEDRMSVINRAFQGHVVSSLNEFKPVKMTGRPFSVYELSFLAPRGLSGAPLFDSRGTIFVQGVIIGNSESRMLVFRSEERENEAGESHIYEHYESLSLGIAVQVQEALSQSSSILGSTLRNHLEKNDLLEP